MAILIRPICIAFFAVSLGACGSLNGLLGSDGGAGPAATSAEHDRVMGTVRSVDSARRVIELGQAGDSAALRETRARSLSYDTETVVEYRGERYRPEDLEPGDRIEAQTESRNGTSVARTIVVTQDVRDAGAVGSEDR
jgi:hypothetical protein